jgi:hypothetical protein
MRGSPKANRRRWRQRASDIALVSEVEGAASLCEPRSLLAREYFLRSRAVDG